MHQESSDPNLATQPSIMDAHIDRLIPVAYGQLGAGVVIRDSNGATTAYRPPGGGPPS